MRAFDLLFDDGEPSSLEHPAYAPYGRLGFPASGDDRPWIYSNFVQTLDGIASLKGKYASGSHISQSEEDRWLMDLLRAHADAVLIGINTLAEETEMAQTRGPVFRIMDRACRELRQALGRGREMNVFVTGARTVDLSAYRVFDGEFVTPVILTTREGEARLRQRNTHPHVRVIPAGEGAFVDLPFAMRRLRQELGIRYLLCEGGPTLYGYMSRAGLIDEKFVTISPVEVGEIVPSEQPATPADREIAAGALPPYVRPTVFAAPGFTKDDAAWWRWMSCRRVGEHQFSRYRRSRSASSVQRSE